LILRTLFDTRRSVAHAILLVCLPACLTAAPHFYHNYPYGTESLYNPLSVTLNASFDILQVTNRNNVLAAQHIGSGFRNVFDNLRNPARAIDAYGWRRFWTNEVIPLSFHTDDAQYVPNYKLHLIGGGMTYVMLAEWYEAHHWNYPRTLAVLTVAGQRLLNEAVENGDFKGPNTDPIADLLIFDPLGVVLFSIPGVPGFFADRMGLRDWSFQPFYLPQDNSLRNSGQKFSYKVALPGLESWRLFYFSGIEGMGGLSKRLNEADDLSAALGLIASRLVDVDSLNGSRKLTTKLVWAGGLFYDRNGSLLASLIFGGPRAYLARLNIFPGVLHWRAFSPGLALLYQKNGAISLGLTARWSPVGIGVASRS